MSLTSTLLFAANIGIASVFVLISGLLGSYCLRPLNYKHAILKLTLGMCLIIPAVSAIGTNLKTGRIQLPAGSRSEVDSNQSRISFPASVAIDEQMPVGMGQQVERQLVASGDTVPLAVEEEMVSNDERKREPKRLQNSGKQSATASVFDWLRDCDWPLLLGLSLCAIWVAGMFVGLIRIGVLHIRSQRFANRCIPVSSPVLNRLITDLKRSFPAVEQTSVVQSAECRVPCVLGWVRPILIVPTDMDLLMGDRELNCILKHEFGHLLRGDLHTRALELMVQVMYWWNPLIYLLCSHLSQTRELLCDEFATSLDMEPSLAELSSIELRRVYARCLVRMVERATQGPETAGALKLTFLRRSEIEIRLVRLLDMSLSNSIRPYSKSFAGGMGIFLFLGFIGASVGQVREPADANNHFVESPETTTPVTRSTESVLKRNFRSSTNWQDKEPQTSDTDRVERALEAEAPLQSSDFAKPAYDKTVALQSHRAEIRGTVHAYSNQKLPALKIRVKNSLSGEVAECDTDEEGGFRLSIGKDPNTLMVLGLVKDNQRSDAKNSTQSTSKVQYFTPIRAEVSFENTTDVFHYVLSPFDPEAEGQRIVSLLYEPLRQVRVLVVSENQTPIPGASICVMTDTVGSEFYEDTDDHGVAKFLIPSHLRVKRLIGWSHVAGYGELPASAFSDEILAIENSPELEEDPNMLVLSASQQVELKFKDANGNPMQGGEIPFLGMIPDSTVGTSLANWHRLLKITSVDRGGEIRLPRVHGLNVGVHFKNYQPTVVDASTTSEVVLKKMALLKGRVVKLDGSPVPRARVRICQKPAALRVNFTSHITRQMEFFNYQEIPIAVSKSTVADLDGYYEIYIQTNEFGTIEAFTDELEFAAFGSIPDPILPLASGEVIEQPALVVRPLTTVSGVLRDKKSSEALEGRVFEIDRLDYDTHARDVLSNHPKGKLFPWVGEGPVKQIKTDSNGEFSLRLPEGTYRASLVPHVPGEAPSQDLQSRRNVKFRVSNESELVLDPLQY